MRHIASQTREAWPIRGHKSHAAHFWCVCGAYQCCCCPCPHAAVLLLKGCLEDVDAVIIGALLTANTRLEMLDLTGNSLGVEGVAALAAGLQKNQTLTDLRLDPNTGGADANEAREQIRQATYKNRDANQQSLHAEQLGWLEARRMPSFKRREERHIQAAERAAKGEHQPGDLMISPERVSGVRRAQVQPGHGQRDA